MSKVSELRETFAYENGKADQCATILSLFDSQLPEGVKGWLYEQRKLSREASCDYLEQAIEVLKDE